MRLINLREIEKSVCVVLTLFILFTTPRIVSGSLFFCLTSNISASVSSPPVILQNVTNSFIYTNYTSARVVVPNGTCDLSVLKILNQTNDPWKLQLIKYSDNNVSRLTNCTIWVHNGDASVQIKIANGIYSKTSGDFYNFLPDMDTYITITSLTNSSGISYIYTYLKILKPNTSTYFLYIIMFELT